MSTDTFSQRFFESGVNLMVPVKDIYRCGTAETLQEACANDTSSAWTQYCPPNKNCFVLEI